MNSYLISTRECELWKEMNKSFDRSTLSSVRNSMPQYGNKAKLPPVPHFQHHQGLNLIYNGVFTPRPPPPRSQDHIKKSSYRNGRAVQLAPLSLPQDIINDKESLKTRDIKRVHKLGTEEEKVQEERGEMQEQPQPQPPQQPQQYEFTPLHQEPSYTAPKTVQDILERTRPLPTKRSYAFSERAPARSVFELNHFKKYPVMLREFSDDDGICVLS